MKLTDLEFAFYLIETENWNNSPEDLARLLSYEPKGCFIAELEDRPAGMVMTTQYGPLAWIGCLIVKRTKRGMGMGTELVKRAIEYLKGNGVITIRLDAVEKAFSLYKNLGFVNECRSLRFQGSGGRYSNDKVGMMKTTHLKDVFLLDNRIFGASRLRVLRKVFHAFPNLCFVSYKKSELIGYIMARQMRNGYRIGPWICQSNKLGEERATLLLRTLLDAIDNNPVELGVLEKNHKSQEIIKDHDFIQKPWNWRMRFGPDGYKGEPQGVFSIGSPAKG